MKAKEHFFLHICISRYPEINSYLDKIEKKTNKTTQTTTSHRKKKNNKKNPTPKLYVTGKAQESLSTAPKFLHYLVLISFNLNILIYFNM